MPGFQMEWIIFVAIIQCSFLITLAVIDVNDNSPPPSLLPVTEETLDVNDEPPYFTNSPYPYLAVVSPNARAGHLVYSVEAEDPDTDSNVIFTLVAEMNRFALMNKRQGNKHMGDIIVAQGASFIPGQTYRVVVEAKDQNAPNIQTARAVVQVYAGQRAPQFLMQNYTGEIPEGGQPGKTLLLKGSNQELVIRAKSFQGQTLTYELTDDNNLPTNVFVYQPQTGTVQVLQTLNYELRTAYSLKIRATESTTNLHTTVDIKVEVMFSLPNCANRQRLFAIGWHIAICVICHSMVF